MADNPVAPPPEGFTIDAQQTPAPQASADAPPEGFTLDKPEPELKPEEKPAVEVGAQPFLFASRAAKTGIKYIGGAVQTGAELLKSIGIPTNPEAIEKVRKNIEDNFDEFSKKSMKYYGHKEEEYPVTGAVGDAAGQLLVYAATGPAFVESAFGKAAMRLGPVLGGIITGAAQGGTLEGLASDAKGKDKFYSALGGAFGGGIGAGIGAAAGSAVVKGANALRIGSLTKQLKAAASNWEDDGQALAKAFQNKVQSVGQKQAHLTQLAEQALTRAGLPADITKPVPPNAPQSVKDAVEMVQKYIDETEYLKSNIFSKLTEVGKKESGGTFEDANESILKAITGGDKELSNRVWKAFSPSEREYLQKGVLYEALKKSTKSGSAKYNPEKLKEFLSSDSIKPFFQGTQGKRILEGFQNIVTESTDHNFAAHPLATSHLAWSLAGGAVGYEKGDFEGMALGAVGGYVSYLAVVSMLKHGLGSQLGKNLFAAASTAKPGTPRMARIFDRLATLGMTSAGAQYEREEMMPRSVMTPSLGGVE